MYQYVFVRCEETGEPMRNFTQKVSQTQDRTMDHGDVLPYYPRGFNVQFGILFSTFTAL